MLVTPVAPSSCPAAAPAGDSGSCPKGWKPYCCNSNASTATCLAANNQYSCTSQYGSSYKYGWCKNNSC